MEYTTRNEKGEYDKKLVAQLKKIYPKFVKAQLTPHPPISAGLQASIHGASSMIDVSDGLAKDASRIAHASRVGINFFSKNFSINAQLALTGAEDHGLLATFSKNLKIPSEFQEIGEVVKLPGKILLDNRPIDAKGWDSHSGSHDF